MCFPWHQLAMSFWLCWTLCSLRYLWKWYEWVSEDLWHLSRALRVSNSDLLTSAAQWGRDKNTRTHFDCWWLACLHCSSYVMSHKVPLWISLGISASPSTDLAWDRHSSADGPAWPHPRTSGGSLFTSEKPNSHVDRSFLRCQHRGHVSAPDLWKQAGGLCRSIAGSSMPARSAFAETAPNSWWFRSSPGSEIPRIASNSSGCSAGGPLESSFCRRAVRRRRNAVAWHFRAKSCPLGIDSAETCSPRSLSPADRGTGASWSIAASTTASASLRQRGREIHVTGTTATAGGKWAQQTKAQRQGEPFPGRCRSCPRSSAGARRA